MLRLQKISLFNFKNYEIKTFAFSEKVICISGPNGSGKTNLLDAIYYLCFTKSYFSRQDHLHVREGQQGFRLDGYFSVQGKEEHAVCILRENGKKEFFLNDIRYDKFSAHIGKFPCIFIAPDDVKLIIGGSEERRKFMDLLIAQSDPGYLKNIIIYTKYLEQRNALLFTMRGYAPRHHELLNTLDEQLIRVSQILYQTRCAYMEPFIETVKELFKKIMGSDEAPEIEYYSDLKTRNMHEILKQNLKKDTESGRTTEGIHRDDLIITVNGKPFKNRASQGQRKSLLFALKLGEFEWLSRKKGISPVLLFDDIFEKLDEHKIHNLLTIACKEYQGQVFITDTNAKRMQDIIQHYDPNFQLISL
ncbi:MAG: DNA replication and repair protein RecF [Chitinophagaceae bacterium]|nr:DNA replication and repair protein RecF [Chitinophagaceae bacterium]